MGSLGVESGRRLGMLVLSLLAAYSLSQHHPEQLSDTVLNALELSTSELEERNQFEAYVRRHRKVYEGKDDRNRRFRNFRESLAFVREHNSDPHRSFSVGLNEFADMDQHEFASKYLVNQGLEESSQAVDQASQQRSSMAESLTKRASELPELEAGRIGEGVDEFEGVEMGTMHRNSGMELPRHVDWSKKSGDVYKQGVCAACYTFTTNSAIKAQYESKTGKTMPELSDQQILSCSRDFGNHGCVGGNMEKSYRYILGKSQPRKLALAKQYPYTGDESPCKAARFEEVDTHLKGFRKVERGSEEDLQDALAQHPVAVGIDAHHPAFKLYESGVFDIDYCTSRLTHAVLLTGYGVDENGSQYYTLKNSWGKGWGHKGFGKIKRGVNMCAIANLASYPIVKP